MHNVPAATDARGGLLWLFFAARPMIQAASLVGAKHTVVHAQRARDSAIVDRSLDANSLYSGALKRHHDGADRAHHRTGVS